MCWKYIRWWNWQNSYFGSVARELTKNGKKPAIIRKFYKNHYDEYNLITKYFKNLITNKDSIGNKQCYPDWM